MKGSLIAMVDLNFNKEFQEKDELMEKKRVLLLDLKAYMEEGTLRKGFSKDFFSYLNELSFRMLNGGEDYYALFMGDTYREIDFNLPFPTASVLRGSKIQFLFNPQIFLQLEEREAVAMIKHEILHILLKHHGREKALKNKFRKLAINLAMDISVNQYINHLPAFVERINSVNMRFDLNLKTNETLEFYTEEIHQAIMEHPKEAKELLETVMDLIEAGVLQGERVPLGKIGKVYAKVKPATKARKGRNPITGEEITIAAKKATKVPKFTFSKGFKEEVLKAKIKK